MIYLLVLGLIIALLCNHVINLFLRRKSIFSRMLISSAITVAACGLCLLELSRLLSYKVMNFPSIESGVIILLFSIASAVLLQLFTKDDSS